MSQATYSLFLSWFVVFGQVSVLGLILLLVFKKDFGIVSFVKKHALVLSLITVTFAVLGSLTYSDIYNIEPCKLCWYQRIFMYPLFVLLPLGIFLKDQRVSFYGLILAILGAPIALYHYLLQRGVVDAGCSVVGNYSVSCSQYFKLNLGYITIPLMAFTAFAMVITFLSIHRKEA